MSAHAQTIALLCTVLGAVAVVATGVVFCLRTLWNIRGSWDATNAGLATLVREVGALVLAKDREHSRLEQRTAEVSERLERHLSWHDKH